MYKFNYWKNFQVFGHQFFFSLSECISFSFSSLKVFALLRLLPLIYRDIQIAAMIVVNMCVQCLFNLNFARDSHKFFPKIKSLSLLLSFFFSLCTYVYGWIMYICMYVCVCACVVVVLYWNIFKSDFYFMNRLKNLFLPCYKKRSSQSLSLYIRKKIQESSLFFFFPSKFSWFIFELSRRLLHTNIFKAIFTFSPDIMFPYYS